MRNFVKFDNVIDSESLLKEQNSGAMADVIHPNEKGYGILAQEIYNRLALSPSLNSKIKSVYEKGLSMSQFTKLVVQENQERDAAEKLAVQAKKK